jgi:hypothetical protein
MTEIGELIAQPEPHDSVSVDCPFCPADDPEGFTTYPGDANNSKTLAAIMKKPETLVEKQGGARPKDGNDKRQSPSGSKPMPTFSAGGYEFSFEAHHAISGNQAMKGEPIEDWLLQKNGLIKKDTGYSINNSDNGVWLPSIPKESGIKWGALDFEEKLRIASIPMEKNKGQFHKGPHDITDPDPLFGEYHKSYADELKRLLYDLFELIQGWSDACFLCEGVDKEKGPFNPNWKVHDMLDRLSSAVATELRLPASTWEYFISKVALEYHKTPGICDHIHMK